MDEPRLGLIKSWNEKAENETDVIDKFMFRCVALSALCQTWSALENPSTENDDDGYVVVFLFEKYYKNIDCFRNPNVIASFRDLVNRKAPDGSQVIGREVKSHTKPAILIESADNLVQWLNESNRPNYDIKRKKEVAKAFAVIVREVRNNLFHGKKGHKIDRDKELIQNIERLLSVFITPIIADLDKRYN